MRRLPVLLAILVALPAGARTYFVGPPSCNAKPATCGDTDDADRCCTPQDAVARAKPGDTIVVHGGTYTSSTRVTINGTALAYSLDVNKKNLTIRKATGETPVLSGSGTVNGCVVVRPGGSGLVLDGLTCQGHVCGTRDSPDGYRTGIVYVSGAARVRLRNMTIGSALAAGSGEFACGGVRLSGPGTDDIVVEDSTLSGHFGHSVLIELTSGSSGIVVRNNTITEDGTGEGAPTYDPGRIFGVKQTATAAPIVICANRVTKTGTAGDNPLVFLREPGSATHVVVFDNICVGCANGAYGSIYTQDNVFPYSAQNVDVFNNTVTGSGQAVSWANYFSALRVQNNIFDGASHGIRGYASDASGGAHGDPSWDPSRDFFTYNVLERSSGKGLAHPSSSPSPAGHVSTTGTIQTRGARSARDGRNRLTAALGIATNDPLATGTPGSCSITAAGLTIDCSLDIDGADRGTRWDAGAVQYGGDVK